MAGTRKARARRVVRHGENRRRLNEERKERVPFYSERNRPHGRRNGEMGRTMEVGGMAGSEQWRRHLRKIGEIKEDGRD